MTHFHLQSYKESTALLYSVAHLGNLLRSPISIGSKIKFYRPDGNRMVLIGGMKLSDDLLGRDRVLELTAPFVHTKLLTKHSIGVTLFYIANMSCTTMPCQ